MVSNGFMAKVSSSDFRWPNIMRKEDGHFIVINLELAEKGEGEVDASLSR